MKVIVELSEEDIERIRSYLTDNRIPSLSQFISVSIQNQLALEKGVLETPNLESLSQPRSKSRKEHQKTDTEDRRTIDPYKVGVVNELAVKDDFPFWGTQNKYLCLKQITLDFADLASEEGHPWIRYDVVMNKLLQGGIETRGRFEDIDELLRRPRGEKLSTGFPRNDSKSLTRYEKQFIGGIDGGGNPYGMAVTIGFLAARKEETSNRVEFGITKGGLDFSALDSLVFAKNPSEIQPSTPILSNEEVQFIISTLRRRKKSEVELMEFTLDYIAKGTSSPKDGCAPTKEFLDRKYPEIAKEKKDGSFSILEAETIRAGVISRMNELELIEIVKKGIASEYRITSSGKEFLKILRRE